MDVRQRGRARFGPFSLDLGTGELRKFGIKVLLQSQPFEVLRVLLERAGELVTREELKERIWGSETYVDFDQGLNRAIKKIRASLNDPTDTPKFIETLAKRGYRFAAPVSFDPEAAAVPGEQSPPSISRVAKGRMQLALATGAAALSVVALMSFFLKRHEGAEETRGNLRQLTRNSSENSLINAIISPDGNYLLFGDLTGIHLRLIATQETHTLGRPTGLSTDAAWFPVSWFPDQSRFIAVSAGSTRDGFKIKSWIVSVLQGAITPLRDDAFAQSVSTDGSLISYLSGGPSLDQEIWITGQHGEEGRRLETLNGRGSFAGLEWAPHGHHLAALGRRFRTGNPPEFFIESRDLTDSPPVTVVSQEKVFQSFFWLSDETISYVTIDGGTALWDVHVDRQTGKAVGKPRRTNKWPTADICSISRSRDGKKDGLSSQNKPRGRICRTTRSKGTFGWAAALDPGR